MQRRVHRRPTTLGNVNTIKSRNHYDTCYLSQHIFSLVQIFFVTTRRKNEASEKRKENGIFTFNGWSKDSLAESWGHQCSHDAGCNGPWEAVLLWCQAAQPVDPTNLISPGIRPLYPWWKGCGRRGGGKKWSQNAGGKKTPAGSCCFLWKTSPYFKKCFYPVSLQVPTWNTCTIYSLILFVGKNAPVSTNLIANVVNKAVRSFYISVLQLPQTTRASHRFVFHLTLGLNPRPSEFWLEGSEGSVPPPLNRHDSLCDCENIDMPRLLIVYASPFPTTESHTRQNKFQTGVMQNVLWCLNLWLGFAYCLKMPII